MFAYKPKPLLHMKYQYKSLDPVIYLSVEDKKSGEVDMYRDGIHFKATIGIGKTNILYDKFIDTLKSVRYWAIQYNSVIVIDYDMATEYPNYDRDKIESIIDSILCKEGIEVIIHNTH